MNIGPAYLFNFVLVGTVFLRYVSTNFNIEVPQPGAVVDATSFLKAVIANFHLSMGNQNVLKGN